jgi:hypothetical protein
MKTRTLLAWLAAGASLVLNKHFGTAATASGYIRAVGTPMILGLLCIQFPEAFSGLASLGIRRMKPQQVSPTVFVVLGWIFLFASLIPIF